jgi:hypothetical protein
MLATSSEKKRYQERFRLTHAISCLIRQPAVNFFHLPVTDERRNVSYAKDSLGAGNGHCSEQWNDSYVTERKVVGRKLRKKKIKDGKQERRREQCFQRHGTWRLCCIWIKCLLTITPKENWKYRTDVPPGLPPTRLTFQPGTRFTPRSNYMVPINIKQHKGEE